MCTVKVVKFTGKQTHTHVKESKCKDSGIHTGDTTLFAFYVDCSSCGLAIVNMFHTSTPLRRVTKAEAKICSECSS